MARRFPASPMVIFEENAPHFKARLSHGASNDASRPAKPRPAPTHRGPRRGGLPVDPAVQARVARVQAW